jgi:hypothetical protein
VRALIRGACLRRAFAPRAYTTTPTGSDDDESNSKTHCSYVRAVLVHTYVVARATLESGSVFYV